MKVPANLSGDRLILDYLARVTVAGTRYLPKGSRMTFVGKTRSRIEREVGPTGTADPAHVREVLARLGDPEDLVRAERARLDAERLSRQSPATAADADAEAAVAGPVESRPINSRWRPATRARPTRGQPPAGQDTGPQERPASRGGAAGDSKRRGRLGGLLKDRPGARPDGPEAEAPPAAAAHPPADTAGQAPAGTAGQAPDGRAGQPTAGAAAEASAGAARQAPGGTAGQPSAGTAGPAADGRAGGAAGGPVRWPSAGPGAQPSGGTGSPAPGTTGTQPLGGAASGGAGTGAPGDAGTRAGTPGRGAGGSEPPPQEPAGLLTPTAVIPPTAGSRPTGRTGSSGPDTPVHGIPVLPPRTRAPREPLTLRTAAAALGRRAARLAVSGARLARRYPLETAAVLLLALGGFVLPFPYWLFGGLVGGLLAIGSPMWLPRDKWAAVFGPVLIMIAGTVLVAVITGGRGGVVTAYPHVFVESAGNLLRLGNLLCAAYLVVQARRAPQRRLPPWQRQRQPPPWQLR